LPSNIKQFLYNYENSKFIECNQDLVQINKFRKEKYEQNMTKNEVMMSSLKYVTRFLEDNQKHYWLFGGTLLGI
jgi:hypothetical protein